MAEAVSGNGSRTGSRIQTLLVGVSVLLNLFLAVHLLKGKSNPPGAAAEAAPAEVMETSLTSSRDSEVINANAAATNGSPFQWGAMESTDFRRYIANLRAAGCSEQVIRDIITAEVAQKFAKRAREIYPRPTREYWQRSRNERPSPKQMEQLMKLGKEQEGVLQDLLGVRISQQGVIDTLYLQVHGSEHELLFLSPERREAALNALAESEVDKEELKANEDYSSAGRQKLFNKKLEALANVLTPEELEDFHQRNSPAASVLKSEVRFLDLTPEQYRQLLGAKEFKGDAQPTKELVRELFGDDTATRFERVSSAFYINARTGAEAEGIPLTQVDEAAKFATDTLSAGQKMAQDKSLPVEERQARLKEYESQADLKLKGLLGEKGAKALLRDLHGVLRSSAAYIQP